MGGEEKSIRKLKKNAGTAGRSEWGIKLHDGERCAVSSCSYRVGYTTCVGNKALSLLPRPCLSFQFYFKAPGTHILIPQYP